MSLSVLCSLSWIGNALTGLLKVTRVENGKLWTEYARVRRGINHTQAQPSSSDVT